MQLETTNKIYQYYLRFLGLSCYSPNRTVEYLLIAYHLLIICHEINHAFEQYIFFEKSKAEHAITSNFTALIEIILFLCYKITRIIVCIRVILWRSVEMKILQKLQQIEDDFQLKLFHHYERSSYFRGRVYKYYWLIDLSWHIFVFILVWSYTDFVASLWNYRFTFTIQATRAIYWQFVLFIKKIDENLENLQNCLKINLQRQQQQLNKHPPEIVNECIVLSVLSLLNEDSSLSFKNWPVRGEVKPYLLQRIWIMKCIYGKISQVTKLCSSCFGSSVLLANFLCIWDFTELMYIMVTVMGFGSFSSITLIFGLCNVLPSLIALIVMCRCCDNCSIRVSKVMQLSCPCSFKSNLEILISHQKYFYIAKILIKKKEIVLFSTTVQLLCELFCKKSLKNEILIMSCWY